MEITKKISIQLFVFLLLVFGVSCLENSRNSEKMPPNILWLVCEDQWSDFFPMYGDSTVSLPNLEKLAGGGITFDRAFATVPVCAPSRSALMTGMYPTTLGTHNMRTYNAWNAANLPEIGIPSYSPQVPENVRCFTEYLRKAGYYCTNNAKEDYNFDTPLSAWDESSRDAHWRNRPEGRPFFSVFNFNITHESRIWVNGDSTLLVNPASIQIPPFFPQDSIILHDFAVNYSNLIRMDHQIGIIIQQLKDDELFNETIIFFYSDHGGPFPRYKRALYETGIKIPLIIRVIQNHDQSTRNDEMVSFIDFAPTVLSLAGIKPPDHMQGKAFLGEFKTSRTPTFVFTSADRFDETTDRVRAIRSEHYKYIRNFNPSKPHALPNKYRLNMPMMQRLQELHKNGNLDSLSSQWMADQKPPEELYDLNSDPFELHNLAEKPEFQDTLQMFRDRLEVWVMETNDMGRFDEKDLLEMWLPGGVQPKLDPPQLVVEEDQLNITTNMHDATIIWKYPSDNRWTIYDQPIQRSTTDTIQIKAVRIGYEDSDTIVSNNMIAP